MWTTEWRALSARIAGIFDSARFLDLKTRDSTYWDGNRKAAAAVVFENAKSTVGSLERFLQANRVYLSGEPGRCLQRIVATLKGQNGPLDKLPEVGLLQMLTSLASFRAEFEHLISDTESVVKSLVLRAFAHLQSSIMADSKVRDSWKDAFDKHEPACERLGASHLLLHGIWSFKANTQGARTDLVLGEPREDWDEPMRAAQGLVLTEWKCVTNPAQLENKEDEALKQAKIYSAEPLAGFEVATTRYLVLVSEKRLRRRPPTVENGILYEYPNIAVDPDTPSADARKTGD